MYSLHWFFSEPGDSDSGEMPLNAAALEDAEREALTLAGKWYGWRRARRGKAVFSLAIYEGGKRLSTLNASARVWERA